MPAAKSKTNRPTVDWRGPTPQQNKQGRCLKEHPQESQLIIPTFMKSMTIRPGEPDAVAYNFANFYTPVFSGQVDKSIVVL
jgi:hypothetical protein